MSACVRAAAEPHAHQPQRTWDTNGRQPGTYQEAIDRRVAVLVLMQEERQVVRRAQVALAHGAAVRPPPAPSAPRPGGPGRRSTWRTRVGGVEEEEPALATDVYVEE